MTGIELMLAMIALSINGIAYLFLRCFDHKKGAFKIVYVERASVYLGGAMNSTKESTNERKM